MRVNIPLKFLRTSEAKFVSVGPPGDRNINQATRKLYILHPSTFSELARVAHSKHHSIKDSARPTGRNAT